MPNTLDDGADGVPRGPFGWKAVLLTLALHVVGLALATYPTVLTWRTTVPDRGDSLQHLWVMRWYKSCLLEGRSVFFCPEIQYPAGSPFGNFSPLHFQALLYFPLSFMTENDAVCFNIVWTFCLLMTGLGTSLLVWHLVGNRACAAFGGLTAMLASPVLEHASGGHTELITLGWFPIFLVAWMRFVDRPGWRRLAGAAALYVLVAMSAAYYMVFAVFPAVLYVICGMVKAGRAGVRDWSRVRAPWFAGMIGLTLPCLLVLFSGHIWAVTHGYELGRGRVEFEQYVSRPLGYLTPNPNHLLGILLGTSTKGAGPAVDAIPYLGLVTIALLAYAAARRAGLKHAGFVWGAFGLMVVLSIGPWMKIGGWKVSMPADWLWHLFPPMKFTRAPSRFSLFAGVFAGVLGAAGLRALLDRLPGRGSRAVAFGLLSTLVIADSAIVPFPREDLLPIPGCYAFLKQRDPKATVLEVPSFGSGGMCLNATCMYWQSRHRLTTSAGSSGHRNALQDRMLVFGSPFLADRLADESFLADPGRFNLDLSTDLEFPGYLWLYLTANRFDYVVVHQWKGSIPEKPRDGPVIGKPVHLERIKALMRDYKVYEDAETVVYDRALIKPPTRPVQICLGEWSERVVWEGRWNAVVPKTGRVLMYNPAPDLDLALQLDSAAVRTAQTVRLSTGTSELARWDVEPGGYQSCYSPPFRLPAGLHELTVVSEPREPGLNDPAKPDGLRVARVSVFPAAWMGPIARQDKGSKGTVTR